MIRYSDSPYPYFCWIRNHTKLNQYKPNTPYNKNECVTLGRGIYMSMTNNNTKLPNSLINWIKLK